MILVKYLEELNNWYRGIHTNKSWEGILILKQIEKNIGLAFVTEPFGYAQSPEGNVCMINSPEVRDDFKETFSPNDLLAYIYAMLYSPNSREKHQRFLNSDFSRVPCPANLHGFWNLVGLGGELRQLHLLESVKVENLITSYPIDGSNEITTKIGNTDWELVDTHNELGRIWINESQYFDKIPLTAWAFYIGGDQPAQKWLKARKGRILDFDDILHYQKVILALKETFRLMQDIATYKT